MADDAPYDYGELLVLRHDPRCGLAALTPTLDGRATSRPYRVVDTPTEGVPALGDEVRGVLVLGGPQSVTDPGAHPWVDDELALIRTAVEREVPVFGICLGAQLAAVALGGAVERRTSPNVGIVALRRTAEAPDDEIFAGWPDGGEVVFANEDEVTSLPGGATAMLVGSDGTPAWSAADGRVHAVQFHPEVDAATVAGWAASPDFLSGDELATEVEHREPFLRAVGVALVGRWLDGVVGADDPTPRKHAR